MHIVVLDDVAFNGQQLARLRSLPDVTVTEYKKNPKNDAETLRRLKDADIAVLAWTELDAELLEKLPQLKMIAISQSGDHYVDFMYAATMGIVVSNVPGYAGAAIAEHIMGLLLALARRIIPAVEATRDHDYAWRDFEGVELRGKTLGVIGAGSIGGSVVKLAKAFGMRVVVNTLTPTSRRADQLEVQFVSLEELLSQSDFVTLQVPLNSRTYHLMSDREFHLMKPTAYFISTTRGNVVDYSALRRAVENKLIAGAALDAILVEEWSLTRQPNIIVTPRIGAYTTEALLRKGDITISNIERFLAGDPANVAAAPRV